jgi:hypothetical protein
MHIRALHATYTPPLPSLNVKPSSVGFQQIQRQIAAQQQDGEPATSASAVFQAAVAAQQQQQDLAPSQKQANGSSATATSSGSSDVVRGLSTGSTGRLIDLIA